MRQYLNREIFNEMLGLMLMRTFKSLIEHNTKSIKVCAVQYVNVMAL